MRNGTSVRELANKRQLQDRWPDERFMDSVIDSWEGSYTIRKTDPFEHIDEQRLMDSIGLPSFSSGNSDVTLTVPRRELSQAVLNARQATRQIINIKLMQLGIGGLAVGSTAAVINNSQSHDQDANVIINPFPGTLVCCWCW